MRNDRERRYCRCAVRQYLQGGKHPVTAEWMGDLAYMDALGELDWKVGLTKVQVGAGKSFETAVRAGAGDVIVWEFGTEKHNVKFSLLADGKEVVPEEKHECEDQLVSGRYQVEKVWEGGGGTKWSKPPRLHHVTMHHTCVFRCLFFGVHSPLFRALFRLVRLPPNSATSTRT